MSIAERAHYHTRWTLRRYANQAAFDAGAVLSQSIIDGNMLLVPGINELWTVLAGLGGAPFSAANARLGVGDSTAAEASGQTDLQASANKVYKGMSPGYPTVTGATIKFGATFTGAEANYAWREFVVDNGSGPAKRLNRKVSDQGTKAPGQIWDLELEITLS